MTQRDPDLLIGQKEILAFVETGKWRRIQGLIEHEGFPAALVGGRWESRKSEVEAWHRGRLRQA